MYTQPTITKVILYTRKQTKIKDCHGIFTRSSKNNFFVPPINGQQTLTFYYNAIKDWNLLSNALKNIKNLDKFNLNLRLNNFYQKREETNLIKNNNLKLLAQSIDSHVAPVRNFNMLPSKPVFDLYL